MNAPNLQVRAGQHGQVCVLDVVGDLDSAVCGQFAQLVHGAVKAARPRPKRVVLDLSGLRPRRRTRDQVERSSRLAAGERGAWRWHRRQPRPR